ncbi:hypothetical protein [Dactylosporangium sp. CS-033363]|uniref:hypothetical protein n=1 Tax=Dactylosporangium sp. CS-033363 TaxID=3239935 RepID=UPI003D8BD23A
MTLLLKLSLAPLLVVASSLAGRRWGAQVSGVLVALPIVAGPILLITCLDHGPSFGARAAGSALLGLISLALFVAVFGRAARRLRWPSALGLAWAACLAADVVLARLTVPPLLAAPLVLASAWLAARALPPPEHAPAGASPDLASAGASPDVAVAGATRDVVVAGASPDVAVAGATRDVVVAGASPDVAVAGASPDVAVAGATPDLASAGASPDVAVAGATPDVAVAGASPDVAVAESSSAPAVSREPSPALVSAAIDGTSGSAGAVAVADGSAAESAVPVVRRPPWWDLPARAVATAVLVLTVTGAAEAIGPAATGVLAPFPIATSVVAAFALARDGAGGAVRMLRGVPGGLVGFTVFCLAVALLVERAGTYAAFGLALAITLAVQAAALVLAARRRPATA